MSNFRSTENAPLRSLLADKAVMESLRDNFNFLKGAMASAVGFGANEGLEGTVGVEQDLTQLEMLLDGRESAPFEFGNNEAIILLVGRPPLLIQDGKWEDPRLPEIRKRLNAASKHLKKAIPKVGRVELLNDPSMPYVGTGWMIDEDVLITNRHVALSFALNSGGRFVIRSTPFGRPLDVQIDFNQEFKSPNPPFVAEMVEVLFIEKDDPAMPDMALVRVRRNAGLPEPIELSSLAVKQDDDIAVIGYPARDGSRNDPFAMADIFREIYNVKRLSPGRVTGVRGDRFILTHDCTTLGGNSGSVVLNLNDGKAAGLHFSGNFKVNNFAVTSETLRATMSSLSRRSIVSVPVAVATAEKVPSPAELAGRTGYDADFLGQVVPLPQISGDHELAPVDGRNDGLLHYLHFSVAVHKTRRLALFTAVNIDGDKLFNIRRARDSWNFDPRMDRTFQVGNELYRDNTLDRGHLVRRLDPAWGDTRDEGILAADDTFFYVNSTPQHEGLNQQTWLGLEDHILDNAATQNLKVTVFSGPVFNDSDRIYRDIRIPQEYWKVVAIMNGFTGALSATAYLLSQSELIADLEFVFGAYKTYQLPIRTVEEKTGLVFGELASHDPLNMTESIGPRVIRRRDDLRL